MSYLARFGIRSNVLFIKEYTYDHVMIVILPHAAVSHFKEKFLNIMVDSTFPNHYSNKEDFVFCDPWYGECFTGLEFHKKMPYILGQSSGQRPKLPTNTPINLHFTEHPLLTRHSQQFPLLHNLRK